MSNPMIDAVRFRSVSDEQQLLASSAGFDELWGEDSPERSAAARRVNAPEYARRLRRTLLAPAFAEPSPEVCDHSTHVRLADVSSD
jgi:hypothetical protein